MIKYSTQKQVDRKDTTRKQRETMKREPDRVQQLYCHPHDPTWYGCILCNSEFDENDNVYEIKKMYPFSKSLNGRIG